VAHIGGVSLEDDSSGNSQQSACASTTICIVSMLVPIRHRNKTKNSKIFALKRYIMYVRCLCSTN
jgi:hypothetical protein